MADRKVKNKIHQLVLENLLFSKGRHFITITQKINSPLANGTIVDIETTGLEPKRDHIITLGTLKNDQIRIRQLITCEYRFFRQKCHDIVHNQPKPWFAYNSDFERTFLQMLNPHLWQNLTQYFEVEYDCENPYRAYRLTSTTFHPFPGQPYDIDGAQVVEAWRLWLKTKDKNFLTDIIYHNTCDLLRTKQLTEKL